MPSTSTFIQVTGESKRVVTPPTTIQSALRTNCLTMVMFRVGDGEAIFLRRKKQVMLIDGGAENMAENAPLGKFLAHYLTERSLKLKAFDATHPHIDHLNAILPLLVEGGTSVLASRVNYYDNGEAYKNSLKDTLIPKIQSISRINHIHVDQQGTTMTLGSGVHCTLFTGSSTSHGTNYKSVFMSVTFGLAKFLFTGDVYADYERKLIKPDAPHFSDLPADILKITHHGSDGGTCKEFVDVVKPKIAVASSTDDPSHRVEQSVRNNLGTCKIFDTATSKGDIVIWTDGLSHQVDGKEGVIYEVEEISPGLFESWLALQNHQ